MSGYKSILVPVGDAAGGSPAMDLALRVAAAFSAHVIGLHVRTDPATAVPLVGEGMSGAMVEEMMAAAERLAAARAATARTVFDEACARHGVPLATAPAAGPGAAGPSAEWVDVTGREEEVVAWRGRLSDLVVITRPREGAESRTTMTVNAALMESGRPLLLAPSTPPAEVARTVAIAWNGSAEAGRAVAASLPLLARAQTVTILSVSEDERTAGAPAGELAAYLAWHGIAARCETVAAGPHGHAGEALLSECTGRGIDLLVMGAYTHSRLRQLILGGVTRQVLHHADLACLLSH